MIIITLLSPPPICRLPLRSTIALHYMTDLFVSLLLLWCCDHIIYFLFLYFSVFFISMTISSQSRMDRISHGLPSRFPPYDAIMLASPFVIMRYSIMCNFKYFTHQQHDEDAAIETIKKHNIFVVKGMTITCGTSYSASSYLFLLLSSFSSSSLLSSSSSSLQWISLFTKIINTPIEWK